MISVPSDVTLIRLILKNTMPFKMSVGGQGITKNKYLFFNHLPKIIGNKFICKYLSI